MAAEQRPFRAFTLAERWSAVFVVFALVSFACTATLEPTVVVGDDSGGAGSDNPLGQCTTVVRENSEFLICAEALPFAAAEHDCSLRGATLVSIRSSEEQDFVLATVNGLSGDKWLGGRRDDELVWSWPDGSAFWRGGSDGAAEDGAFVAWNGGEPNNASTSSPDPERCLAMTPNGGWNDRACELELPYACQRPRDR